MSPEDRERRLDAWVEDHNARVEALIASAAFKNGRSGLRPCGPQGTCWYQECDMGGFWPFADEPAQVSGSWEDTGPGRMGTGDYEYAGDVTLGATCR
jgi:hypothetical protein